MKQKTIKNIVSFSGKGIHTGVLTNVSLLPAKENTGIVFVRKDLNNHPTIKADVSNVCSTKRCTKLKQGIAEISTVEHLLSAIMGAGIDNMIIEIDNIEIPILDGSAKEFSQLIHESGTIELSEEKNYFKIKRKISFIDEETGASLVATPSNQYQLEIEIDYNSKTLKKQKAKLESIENYDNKISNARTFCFMNELEHLLNNNLIQGGDLNNAIVIVDDYKEIKKVDKLAKFFKNPNIKINKNGILNNVNLRYDNEPARHKLLDVIGDLSLLGRPIKGKIKAFKPGHKNNIKFTNKLKQIMTEEMQNTAPKINFKEQPIYDKKKIESILPHRSPFLFIDEIREIGKDYIVGVKYVKQEEEYFKGHFPNEPIMPGVLQLETMAQAGGVLILSTVEDPENYLTFFMKIDNAKFKQKVIPGDTLIFKLKLISPIRRGLCHMHGKGFVNDKLVVEADLLAQIAKKEK